MLAILVAAGAPAAGDWAPSPLAGPGAPALAALQARVGAIARASTGHVGLAAIDLATGQMVSVNGGERFPMASTVKVAIAAAFLHQVETGQLSLDATYAMPDDDRRAVGRIGDLRRYRDGLPGWRAIELMLIRSDNSAADILLAAIGGTRAVERWLREAGVAGQRVDRSIAELLSDRRTTRRVEVGHGRLRHPVAIAVPRAASSGDPRDSSTPEAMAALLVKLRDGRLLDRLRTSYLFDVMSRCRTGARRIRGLLPPGAPVAHKTGTLDGVTDDVGVIDLPNGHQLALAVFVTGRGGTATHDRSIAQLSRQLYDGFSVAEATGGRSDVHNMWPGPTQWGRYGPG